MLMCQSKRHPGKQPMRNDQCTRNSLRQLVSIFVFVWFSSKLFLGTSQWLILNNYLKITRCHLSNAQNSVRLNIYRSDVSIDRNENEQIFTVGSICYCFGLHVQEPPMFFEKKVEMTKLQS